jgi:hypothetical protein
MPANYAGSPEMGNGILMLAGRFLQTTPAPTARKKFFAMLRLAMVW